MEVNCSKSFMVMYLFLLQLIMVKESLLESVKDKTLFEVISIRDNYDIDSKEWIILNEQKAYLLEKEKPSTKERIIYFDETTLLDIPEEFTSVSEIPKLLYKVDRRSILEYHPEQRHPIPYCIVEYQNSYFFILREKGSGEVRLIGKKGLLGGHVGEEDVNESSLNKTILNGLRRELKEEAGIEDSMIERIEIKGLIKGNDGVDSDHLGIIYQISLNTKEIKSEEKDVLTGIWIEEKDLPKHYDSFESWSKIIYDNILKKPLKADY